MGPYQAGGHFRGVGVEFFDPGGVPGDFSDFFFGPSGLFMSMKFSPPGDFKERNMGFFDFLFNCLMLAIIAAFIFCDPRF